MKFEAVTEWMGVGRISTYLGIDAATVYERSDTDRTCAGAFIESREGVNGFREFRVLKKIPVSLPFVEASYVYAPALIIERNE